MLGFSRDKNSSKAPDRAYIYRDGKGLRFNSNGRSQAFGIDKSAANRSHLE